MTCAGGDVVGSPTFLTGGLYGRGEASLQAGMSELTTEEANQLATCMTWARIIHEGNIFLLIYLSLNPLYLNMK